MPEISKFVCDICGGVHPTESHPQEPMMVARFDAIKEIPIAMAPELADFEPIFTDQAYRQKCFEEAKEGFLFILDKRKINDYLDSEHTEDGLKYLKRIRRIGQILRDNYKAFGVTHLSPENLYQFLFALGEYNDRYWFDSHQGSDTISDNLKANLETLDDASLPIDCADNKEFENYVYHILSEIERLIKKPGLPIKKFHTLRKDIRICADIMQVTAAKDFHGKMHWLFSKILDLSVELGHQHDDFVQGHLRGEIEYADSIADIDPNISEEFMALKPFIERVVGIS